MAAGSAPRGVTLGKGNFESHDHFQRNSGRVRDRARIVLGAAVGVPNHAIGRSMGLARARVLHWRRRFEQEGIRGLWDQEGVLPVEPISPEVERAIVEDCLYQFRLGIWLEWDPSFNWNVRNLARRHGVSRASVQSIWKKHGIRMQRSYRQDVGVDVEQLKISQDPLFPITVYEIAGLYFENANPVLALCSRDRPFSELNFSELSLKERLEIAGDLASRLRQLEEGSRLAQRKDPDWQRFKNFLHAIYGKPRHAGARIHLLLGTAVRFTEHPSIEMHHAPWSGLHPRWSAWAQRWLKVIAAWPMQTGVVASASRMRQRLEQLPKDEELSDALIIC